MIILQFQPIKKIIEYKNKLETILRNSEYNSDIYNKAINELRTIAVEFDGKKETDKNGRFILPQSICEELDFEPSSSILAYEGSYENLYSDFYPCIKVYEKNKRIQVINMKIDTTWLLSLMLIKKKNSYDELFVTTNEYEFIKDILNKNYKVELENDINTYFIKLENDKYIINKENLNGVWELENLYNYIIRNSKTTFELDLIELKKS